MIKINAAGPDGNAHCITARVADVLEQLGRSKEQIDAVMDEMYSGDYRNLCAVAEKATLGLVKIINLPRKA